MKVVSLIENMQVDKNLQYEHGLSLYIEINNKKYLLDTGHSGNFIENAFKLGIDLSELDAIIISHNHSDHIGGIDRLFDLNKNSKVYIKNQAKSKYYHKCESGIYSYIGCRESLFDDFSERFIWIDETYKLDDNLFIMSNTTNDKAFFCQDKTLLKLEDDELKEDDFCHELFLVALEKNKITILSSCSHNGIVNIVSTVNNKFPNKSIDCIIGGFHMKDLSKENELNCSTKYIDNVISELNRYSVNKIYTCHCTGLKAFDYMKDKLEDKIEYLKTGDTVII